MFESSSDCDDEVSLVLKTMQNRSKFDGKIKNGKLFGRGVYIDKNQIKCISYNSTVYYNDKDCELYGQFGDLDLKTGEIDVKPYRIQFENISNFISQLKNENPIGNIVFNNGNILTIQIHNNCPCNTTGQFTDSNGEKGKYCNYEVCMTSGINGYLNFQNGCLESRNYKIQFPDESDYIIQISHTCHGTISWRNQEYEFHGEVFRSLPVDGEMCIRKQIIGRFHHNTLFFTSGEIGTLNLDTGEVALSAFRIKFKYINDDRNQYMNAVDGTVQWSNNNKLDCKLFKGQPVDDGILTLINGESGIYYKDMVYLHDTFGRLDFQTGEIQFADYQLRFEQPEQCIEQYQHACMGCIKYSHGIHYTGYIFQNQPYLIQHGTAKPEGEIVDAQGVSGICVHGVVYFHKTKQLCDLNISNGLLSNRRNVAFRKRCGLYSSTPCQFKEFWSNGNSFTQNTKNNFKYCGNNGQFGQRIRNCLLLRSSKKIAMVDIQLQTIKMLDSVIYYSDYRSKQQQSNTYVYFCNSEQIGYLDYTRGEIVQLDYQIKFTNPNSYIIQYRYPQIGVMTFCKGQLIDTQYWGYLYQNYPVLFGNLSYMNQMFRCYSLSQQSHQSCISILHNEKTSETLEINYLNSTVQATNNLNIKSELMLHVDNIRRFGCVKWKNGYVYAGMIENLLPVGVGIIMQGNICGFCIHGEVCSPSFDGCHYIDMVNEELTKMNYAIEFNNNEDFVKQLYTEVQGSIKWSNGSYYSGSITNNRPCSGSLLQKCKKAIRISCATSISKQNVYLTVHIDDSGIEYVLDMKNGNVV